MVRCLIYIENNHVSVIRLKEDKLEFEKKDGEIEFPITVDFWRWWKRAVSYIDHDAIDVCFVYDKYYDFLQEHEILENNVINTEESEWKMDYIKNYFWTLKPIYFNVVIVDIAQQEYVLDGASTINSRRFYTNIDYPIVETHSARIQMEASDSEDKVNIEEEEYSVFAKYFVDLIRNERR